MIYDEKVGKGNVTLALKKFIVYSYVNFII